MKILSPKILSLAVFIIALCIYMSTLTPGLTFTDSGELAGVASTLGIAHPTGYPLFAMLGYVWTKIFPGRDVYAMNVFAAICTAGSAAVFFLTLDLLLNFLAAKKFLPQKKSPAKNSLKEKSLPEASIPAPAAAPGISLIAAASALLYAFARTVWSQATGVEVYSLHLLLMNCAIYFFLKGSLQRDINAAKRSYILAALFLGLGFTNHLTTIFLLPPVLFCFLWRPEEKFSFTPEKKRLLTILVPVGLAALCLWLYLPLRSAQQPDFNWGGVHRNWEKFWYHASGKQYRVMMGEDYGLNTGKFFGSLPNEFAWAGIALILAGMVFLYGRSRQIFWFAALLLISCLAYSLGYSIHDIENYFLTAYLSLFIFMAAGLLFISEKFPKAVPAFFLLPAAAIAINFSYNNRSQDYMVAEYTRILSENLRPNAIVITRQWDVYASAFWYLQRAEGYRPDVVLIEKELLRRTWYYDQLRKWYPAVMERSKKEVDAFLAELEKFESEKPYDPALIQQSYAAMLNSFIEKNIDRQPVYLTAEIAAGNEDGIGVGYQQVPEGFAVRLEKDPDANFPVSAKNIDLGKFLLFRGEGELENFIRDNARNNLMNIATYALNRGMYSDARPALEKVLQIEPDNYPVQEQLRQLP